MRQAGCLRPGLELGGPATARRPGALVDKEARPVALRVVAAIRGYRVPAQLAVHGRLPVAALVTGRGDIEHREVLSLGLGPARRLGALLDHARAATSASGPAEPRSTQTRSPR